MSKEEPGESSASLAHSNSARSCSVKRKSGEREKGREGGECVGGGGTEEQVVVVVVVKGNDEEAGREGWRGFSLSETSLNAVVLCWRQSRRGGGGDVEGIADANMCSFMCVKETLNVQRVGGCVKQGHGIEITIAISGCGSRRYE